MLKTKTSIHNITTEMIKVMEKIKALSDKNLEYIRIILNVGRTHENRCMAIIIPLYLEQVVVRSANILEEI